MKRTVSSARRLEPARHKAALISTVGLLLLPGCTHVASRHKKVTGKLEEHSRVLTTAIVDVLQAEPAQIRDPHSQLALRLAREDQRIEGLPLEPIPVEPMLTTETNKHHIAEKAKAENALSDRFTEIEKLLAREKRTSEQLLDFGEAHEQERNRTRGRWAKWIGSGSVLLGGLVALIVFVPAVLPILGRVLAWLVGKVPALASALGVVSVKAFDAIVKGVERAKPSGASPGLTNADSRPASNNSWVDELYLNLSREMDASHKELVRVRKANLK